MTPRTRTRLRGVVVALVLALAGSLLAPAAAGADPVNGISIVGGVTDAVYDYADAVRERVFIPVAGVDQDLDGIADVVAIDIIRPRTTDPDLRFAAIIDPSPYYTTVGRGNEGELIKDLDGDGLNDEWPLFFDNYFVPRGYAVILAHMDGTGFSTGCPLHGGPGDIAGMKAVIDWLNGRVPGYDKDDQAVTASWHNGHAGMIGKSYDGTLANGVAATGVAGLSTIVPISAISDWYGYSRTGGIRHNTNYPSSLANTVTNPDRRALCSPTRTTLNGIDGDETGDVNDFWTERNYRLGIANVTASVFAVHGLNDDNVKMSQFEPYWELLAQHDIPRKVWLAKVGHIDPFDYRRAEWVDTLHRWFDYWLYQVPNGIMDEPMATVETDPGVFVDYADWPVPGTQEVELFVAGEEGSAAGSLLLQSSDAVPELSFTGSLSGQSEATLTANPENAVGTRLVFLSEPLTAPLRLSGTPRIELTAALDKTQSNLSAFLVDYGPATRTPRSPGDGVQNTSVRTCWGAASVDDDACYLEVVLRSQSVTQWRLSRGILDSSNRDSLIDGEATLVTPGLTYDFGWPLEPYDDTIPIGHRLGVIVAANFNLGVIGTGGTQVTLDATVSRIILPLAGGLDAAVASGAFGDAAPVRLSFDLGGHGAAIAEQTVPYGAAPAAPAAPSELGWVFRGWFAEAAATTPFDFGAVLKADAVAYALWEDVADAADRLEVHPSATSVDQGDTITVQVNAFDAANTPLGDVSSLVTLVSDVDTDIINGTQVTFVHASPHLITATLGSASASVSIWVEPAAAPADTGGGPLATTGGGLESAPLIGALILALIGVGLVFAYGARTARRS